MLLNLAEFFAKSGMRKVSSCLYVETLTALLALRQVITGEQYVTITVAVLAGLIGGNAFEHHTKAKGGTGNGAASETPKPA